MNNDKLNLPNVCKHLLANPELLTDPMYRKQVERAIAQDEESWTLEQCGRAHEQQDICRFMAVASDIAKQLKTGKMTDAQQFQAFVDFNELCLDFLGIGIEQANGRIPKAMQERTNAVAAWRRVYLFVDAIKT